MDESIMVIAPGQPLPNPGEWVEGSSGLTGKTYLIKVKKVTNLRWNKKGNLVVEFTYTQKKLKG